MTGSGLPRNRVLIGDARKRLRALPDSSVDMVLTSPPYFRLRDYGVPGQLGQEAHVDDWVVGLLPVLAEIRRVLTPTGSLWLNLGDDYALHPREGAGRKSLLLGPERLALALLADGWLLRNKVVWQKTNPIPSPVRDRLSCTWEALYVLTRRPRYFFDLDAIREPHRSAAPTVRPAGTPTDEAWRGPNTTGRSGLQALKARGQVGHPLGKNPGDVWRLGSRGFRSAHHATFPLALADRAIRAGCPEARCGRCRAPWRRRTLQSVGGAAVRGALGPDCNCDASAEPGLVLDPFFGAGTTGVAAERLGRDWLGIELSPSFAAVARERLAASRAATARSP